MLLKKTKLTKHFSAWLASSADRPPPLAVRQVGPDVEVTRADGADLSATERKDVTALATVHEVEPLGPCPPDRLK